MLRIQDCLSFKDPVGRVYKTNEMVLSLRENAKVYTISDSNQYVFVRFIGENHPSESMIQTMCDCSSDMMAKANVLWPEMVCYLLDSDAFCGFLAKRVDIPENLSLLSQIMVSAQLTNIDLNQRLRIGLGIAQCIQAVHQTSRKYVIGVPQPRDFHVTPDGRVFFFYAYRCDMDLRDQLDSVYLAPEYRSMQGGLSFSGDSFSFAMILFNLLTGVQPYGSHAPESHFDDEQIADMVINGESIYYYENSPHAQNIESILASISTSLSNLFRSTFDYCGQNQYDERRPSISEWIGALTNCIDIEKT